MVTYKFNGKELPMALTLKAMEAMDKQYGGIENLSVAFDGKGAMESMNICVDMLLVLLEGGKDYKIMTDGQAEDVPSKEMLSAVLMPKDIVNVKNAIFASISDSMNREVELETDPKNAETTQDI